MMYITYDVHVQYMYVICKYMLFRQKECSYLVVIAINFDYIIFSSQLFQLLRLMLVYCWIFTLQCHGYQICIVCFSFDFFIALRNCFANAFSLWGLGRNCQVLDDSMIHYLPTRYQGNVRIHQTLSTLADSWLQ